MAQRSSAVFLRQIDAGFDQESAQCSGVLETAHKLVWIKRADEAAVLL